MRKVVLLLACLACVGQRCHLHVSIKGSKSSSLAERHKAQRLVRSAPGLHELGEVGCFSKQLFAVLLLVLHPEGAFKTAGPSNLAARSGALARHLPVTSIKDKCQRYSCSRRAILFSGALAALSNAADARAPGSEDVGESIEQIKDGNVALQKLRKEWSTYACIDGEGRACNVDTARRILGGVAPRTGDAAFAAAKETPLYRMDGAFKAIRKYALNSGDGTWAAALDLDTFIEKGDDIVFALKKADDAFYGVVYAAKGTTQLEKMYKDARQGVDQALSDFDTVLNLLREAKAPGL